MMGPGNKCRDDSLGCGKGEPMVREMNECCKLAESGDDS